MPCNMYIDPDLNCVFYKHYGTFAFGEIAETAESRIDHPAFQVGMNILHDVRKLIFPPDHSYKHISEGARSMMATYDPKVGKCRSAMVVGDGRAYAKVHREVHRYTRRTGGVPGNGKSQGVAWDTGGIRYQFPVTGGGKMMVILGTWVGCPQPETTP